MEDGTKKSFRNPSGVGRHDKLGWSVLTLDIIDEPPTFFPVTQWDMEVTFTKKPKPFEPGFFQEKYNKKVLHWFDFEPIEPEWERVTVQRVVTE